MQIYVELNVVRQFFVELNIVSQISIELNVFSQIAVELNVFRQTAVELNVLSKLLSKKTVFGSKYLSTYVHMHVRTYFGIFQSGRRCLPETTKSIHPSKSTSQPG
jgi:hypothetical protein